MTRIILQVGNQPRIFEKIVRVRMLQITRSTLWRTSVSSHFNTRDLFTFFGIRFKELKDYERPGHCGVYIFQPSVIFSVRWAQMWAGAGEEGPWLWRGVYSGPFVTPLWRPCSSKLCVCEAPSVFYRSASTGASPVLMNWLWANQSLSSDWMMMFNLS